MQSKLIVSRTDEMGACMAPFLFNAINKVKNKLSIPIFTIFATKYPHDEEDSCFGFSFGSNIGIHFLQEGLQLHLPLWKRPNF
jgi:hypothetical protein